MAQSGFSQTIWIGAPVDTVVAVLAGLHDLTATHPLVVAVQQLEPETAPDGGPLHRYLITDRVPFGPIRLTATYLATIWRGSDGTVTSDAHQFPRVHLHNVTRCQAEGEGTRVEEAVTIKAPGMLIGYVRRQGFAAHQELLVNLKQVLERGGQSLTS